MGIPRADECSLSSKTSGREVTMKVQSKSSLGAVVRIFCRSYFTARNDTVYRIPDLYEAGVLGRLSKRRNLARGIACVVLAELPSEKNNVVLDIGAGTGIFSLELASSQSTTVAIDVLRPPLVKLSEKICAGTSGPIRLVQADMNQGMPFQDETFDAVTSLRANRYIDCIDQFSEEVFRVLKPRGIMVFPIFLIDSISWRRRSKKGFRQETTSRAVRRTLVKAGFLIDEARTGRYSRIVVDDVARDVPFYYRPVILVATKPDPEERIPLESANSNFPQQ